MSLPTGLYIPAEKRPWFLAVFENCLSQFYNIIPSFGPVEENNLCEIRFSVTYNRKLSTDKSELTHEEQFNKAKAFLEAKLHLLEKMVSRKSRNSKLPPSNLKSIPLIDLVGDSSAKKPRLIKTIDLTKTEPDVIVLDETINSLNSTFSTLEITLDSVDHVVNEVVAPRLTRRTSRGDDDIQIISIKKNGHIDTNNSENRDLHNTPRLTRSNSRGSDFYILNTNIKNVSPLRQTPKSNITSGSKKRKKVTKKERKRLKQQRKSLLNINNSALKSPTRKVVKNRKSGLLMCIQQNVVKKATNDKTPQLKKKKELKDVSNLLATKNPPSKELSDGVLQYYANVEKVIGAFKNSKGNRKSIKRLKTFSPLKQTNNSNNNINKATASGQNQSQFNHNNPADIYNNFLHNLQNSSNPRKRPSSDRKKRKNRNYRREFRHKQEPFRENNVFNPNPYDVDKEGLRPIVIDGCNLAFGHGKGKFSAKGVKICVDYFALRSHDHVKVFLPQPYKEKFTESLLTELGLKCEMVFTPSRQINGVQKSSYDDRFIVQYADEMGGVIISTDNYRDLLKENPRWTKTIQNRLLMFTWVDDFLMFPVDPMGKNGPTLDQLLRF